MFGMGMGRLGLPNRLAGLIAAAYNPATQFAAGGLGAWYDPSDYATLSQDSGGVTPVTAVAQPVGRMLDKSGRNNTLLQATAAARPLTATQGAVQYLTFDGVDDGLSTGAMTFSADMDCFVAIRRATAARCVLFGRAATPLFGYWEAGAAGASNQGCGAAVTCFANGVAIPGGTATTGGQMEAALTVGSWVVLEFRNLSIATMPLLEISTFGGYFFNGDIGGVILAPADDATARQKNRQYLGAKVGLTLP